MAPPENSDRESLLARLYGQLRPHADSVISGASLKAKVFRGGTWLGVGSVTEQAVRLGRNIILTRLLAPEAFGTMAIVLSCCSVLHTIMDLGVREALIQNPRGSEEEYVRSAWWIALGRAASFWILLSLAAPFIATFYGNAELTALFRVAAVGVLLEGALSSRAYVAIREMKFRKWAMINHGGAIIGVLMTIGLSFFLRDVWALVLGSICETLGRVILSHTICPFLPQLKWDGAAARELLGFSRKLFGMSLFNLIFGRADVFVIAKLYSPPALGFYVMAVSAVQIPSIFIMNVLAQTLLPTFSHIKESGDRENRVLLQVTSLLVALGMPAFVFAMFSGRSLLALVYGPRYGAAATSLIAASAVCFLNILNGQITTVFYARGRPDLHRRCVAILAIVTIVLIYPFVKWFGLVGGQLACFGAMLTGYVFQVARVRRLTGLDLGRYLTPFGISAAISVSAVAVYLGARGFSAFARPLPNIAVGIVACLVAYGIAAVVYFRNPGLAGIGG
jgi:O-antigen/teichoic acid export membrane protein